jgi:urea transporter
MENERLFAAQEESLPLPVRTLFRGIGQVFFQDNAITGILFALGIALSSLPMAIGAIVGSAIGSGLAWGLKFDKSELTAGIYGFNATLVGIATLFFFEVSGVSIAMLVGGCVAATLLTWLMRGYLPFPTYTSPFIVVTWVLYLLGKSLPVVPVDPSQASLLVPVVPAGFLVESAVHGVGQVMFQASLWTGLLFLAGIALNNRQHACFVLVASVLGLLLAAHNVDTAMRALDPERLVERSQFDNIQLGLYGYNATLVAVALLLWRPSLVYPLLGIVGAVALTEWVPLLGLPALTAPFVLATWAVMIIARLEKAFMAGGGAPAPDG